ncbi:MAG: hypothetical protein ACH34U_12345 [Cyanobium sp.]
MALPGITNANEFYSAHYLESVLTGDIKKVRERWAEQARAQREADSTAEVHTPEARFKALRKPWQKLREAEFGITADPAERLRLQRELFFAPLCEALGYSFAPKAEPVDFAATFIPHDLEWLREWDALQQQLTPSLEANGTLMRFVCDRLRWEVAAEFGYRSRLGSSVEQAGALAAAVDPAAVNKLLPGLLGRLQNEVEPLRGLRLGQVQQLVVGLLQHLRQRGALALSELVGRDGKVSRYLESGGEDTYPFNQIPHTPKFGRTASRPILLTSFRLGGDSSCRCSTGDAIPVTSSAGFSTSCG